MSAAFPLTSPIEVSGTGGAPGQVNFSDGTNIVEVKAPTTLSGTVSFTLPDANGTSDQILKWPSSGTTTVWGANVGNPNGTVPMTVRFNAPNGDPTNTTSSTYEVFETFIYGGTTTDNPISMAISVVETSNSAATGQLRLFDFSNSLTIAESTIYGPTNGVKIILNLGTISNLPTGQSMFEVQLRRPTGGGGGNAALHSFQLY